jgi:hypothetical protein
MLLEFLIVGVWFSFAGYCFWYFFKAKTFQPLTLDDLALTWRIHKQQTKCTASGLNSLLTRNNEIVGFKCECGYEFQQKRLITQKARKPQGLRKLVPSLLQKLCRKVGGKTFAVILHSYKAETGKTRLTTNSAILFTKMD